MAFSWILGRRPKYLEDIAENEAWPPSQDKAGGHSEHRPADTIDLAKVTLSVEDGLVMAFGPLGDPITPQLLKEACERQPRIKLRLPSGAAVDHQHLISVIEAQQAGRLAEHPSDNWVTAMLGAEGGFEPAPPESLADEEHEGKTVLGGKLVLGTPGGETITLVDAHPGTAGSGLPARLMLDEKPVSIGDVLDRPEHLDPDNRQDAASRPSVSVLDDHLTLVLDGQTEARIEPASSVWDGEAKVALYLADGRPVSLDDLTALLRDIPPCLPAEPADVTLTYPLLAEDEPALDLDRATIVTVSEMPEGWSLTAGKRSRRGAWILEPSSLNDAAVQVPEAHQRAQTLLIKVMSSVGREGVLEQQVRKVVILPKTADGRIVNETMAQMPGDHDQASSLIPLDLDPAEADRARRADALLLRGLPEGASLSEGIYDPSVKGWVLKPDQLDRLAVCGLDPEDEAVDIEIRAFDLDNDGQSRSQIIVSKRITIDQAS